MIGATPQPPTVAGVEAMLQAMRKHPLVPLLPQTIPGTHGLAYQKLAELLRADRPPVSAEDMQQLREDFPGYINLAHQWAIADDQMTHFTGQKLQVVMIGIGVGLRRVPWSIVQTLKQYDGAAQTDPKTMGHIIAGLLREVYPPVSDDDYQRPKRRLPHLIDDGEYYCRYLNPRAAMAGAKMLDIAAGLSVGFGKITLMRILEEFLPPRL